jgi:ribonuclease P protein component, eubacterial
MLRKEVLRRDKDFTRTYNKGKVTRSKYVVIFYINNNLGYNRTAFLASKKVGNAVERNRARRLMKESIRTMSPLDQAGYDIIFVARNAIKNKKCADVKKSIEAAIKRTELK